MLVLNLHSTGLCDAPVISPKELAKNYYLKLPTIEQFLVDYKGCKQVTDLKPKDHKSCVGSTED